MKARFAICIALLVNAGACTSVNPYLENRLVLEECVLDIDTSRFQESAHRLEVLLAETNGEARDFALQRFFAAYLLTTIHARASANPFLQEPVTKANSFGSSQGLQPSRLGHLMALIHDSGCARSLFEFASEAPLEQKGGKQLPAELEYLNLCFLAVHAELNFQDRIDEVLSNSREWLILDSCERALDQVALPAEVRPWVYLAVFEHEKHRDERNAFRFAIRARETGIHVPAFGRERCDRLAHWITEESSFRFISPANQPFDPALEGCTVTGTPNLNYEAIAKEP